MGEGADKQTVRELVAERGLENVTLLDGRPRQEALEMVGATDASLVVLKNTPVFETVIPSKIFEAMALRRPIVLGVKGEAHRIVVEEAHAGLAFPPEDPAGLVDCLRKLQADSKLAEELGANGFECVSNRYRRTRLADRMLAALARIAGTERSP
jgi:glycosyltransferase involved in cell wall biosynthesis